MLASAETVPHLCVLAVRFTELPAPEKVSHNVAEQLKVLVELLRLC